MGTSMRIAKYLSHAGIASRRDAERLIDEGVVSVNGEAINDKGRKVDPGKDLVFVRHQRVVLDDSYVYLLVNKPVDVVSTTRDEQGRETVVDLVSEYERLKTTQLWPVGRLDMDSRGLVLLTDDGDLSHRLTHPKWHIPKVYEVLVAGELRDWKLGKLREGVQLPDGVTAPAEVEVLVDRDENDARRRHLFRIVLYEGKHRQIRRMCAAVRLEVLDLKRVGMGQNQTDKNVRCLLELGALGEREWRELSDVEVRGLREAVEL